MSEQAFLRVEPAFLRVEQGDPTPEELAALVAVLLARAAARAPEPAPGPASTWSAHAATLRGRIPWSPAPDGWRASGRPALIR